MGNHSPAFQVISVIRPPEPPMKMTDRRIQNDFPIATVFVFHIFKYVSENHTVYTSDFFLLPVKGLEVRLITSPSLSHELLCSQNIYAHRYDPDGHGW